MRRRALLCLLCLCLLLSAFPMAARADDGVVTASVPSYGWVLNGMGIDYTYSLYPILNYQGVTYFPMTWDYCRVLGLTTEWVDGQGLFISYTGCEGTMPTYGATYNPPSVEATYASFPIYINGVAIDNASEPYPILLFRDLTYFPMTWRFAREEFNWDTSWDAAGPTFSVHAGIDEYAGISDVVFGADETHAYFRRTSPIQVVVAGRPGVYTTETIDRFYSLDFASGYVMQIEQPPIYDYWNGKDWHDGIVEKTSKRDIQIDNEVNYVQGLPNAPLERKGYVVIDNKKVLVGENLYIRYVLEMPDGNLYVNASRYTHWKGAHNPDQELYKIYPDRTIERQDSRYGDFHSMEMLGAYNGQIIMKCTYGTTDLYSTDQNISPTRDGYYAYSISNGALTLLRRYVYTDTDVLTPYGQIYGFQNWRAAAVRLYGPDLSAPAEEEDAKGSKK